MTNLNLLFNKIYYSKIGLGEPYYSQSLKEHNTRIQNTVFDHTRDYRPSEIAVENGKSVNGEEKLGVFLLKTAYPGLLIGAGNPHGSYKSNDDIKFGFFFDYVSGQPYIPASSVKGVLRSKFKQCPEAVAAILKTVVMIDLGEDNEKTINALETDLFAGEDVFLDAVVYDGEPINGRLLGFDYITHHSSATKNPVPVMFIKVLPEVRFEFRFKLKDSVVNGVTITANNKKKLFKELLKFFGVGAKTNSGYGVFEECGDRVLPKTPIKESVQTAQARATQNNSQNSGLKKSK